MTTEMAYRRMETFEDIAIWSYQLTQAMTSTWCDPHVSRELERMIRAEKKAAGLPIGGSNSRARERELEKKGIKIIEIFPIIVKKQFMNSH